MEPLRPRDLWYKFARSLIRVAGATLFHTRYTGVENIPAQGGILIVGNHQSTLDPPAIGAGCRRHLCFLARKTLFRGLLGALLHSVNAVPLDQEGSPLAGLRTALKRLKEGGGTMIFPEGARSWDGKIAPFQPGFTILARRTNVAIVPAAVEGAWDVWPRWQALPRVGPVHIAYGEPIPPDEVRQRRDRELVDLVERRVHELHAELCKLPVFAKRTWRPVPPTPLPPD